MGTRTLLDRLDAALASCAAKLWPELLDGLALAGQCAAGVRCFPPNLSPFPPEHPMPLDAVPSLVLRRLGDADRPALLRHLLALPPECRHARFGSARTDAHLAAFSVSLDLADSVLGTAAFVGSDAVAVALAAECGRGTSTVEVGVETLPYWRRRGLGSAVCRAACIAAAARGATCALFEFEPANFAVRALVYTLGGSVSLRNGRGTVPLRPGLSEEQLRPRSVSDKWSEADDPAPVPSDRAPDPTLRGPAMRYGSRESGPQAAMISH